MSRGKVRSPRPIFEDHIIPIRVGWDLVCQECFGTFFCKRRDAKWCGDRCRNRIEGPRIVDGMGRA